MSQAKTPQSKKPATKPVVVKPAVVKHGASKQPVTKKVAAPKSGDITLTYFNVRGRCEHIRYLFVAGKVPFKDQRIEQSDWPALKPKTPFGGLPILEIGGQSYGQSIALGRLAAKRANLYGSNDVDQVLIDGLVDVSTEIREAFIPVYFFKGDDKAKEAKEQDFLENKVAKSLDQLAKSLGKNEYFVSNKLSWADIHFLAAIEFVSARFEDVLSKHETLQILYRKVEQNPEIAAYIKKRPQTSF